MNVEDMLRLNKVFVLNYVRIVTVKDLKRNQVALVHQGALQVALLLIVIVEELKRKRVIRKRSITRNVALAHLQAPPHLFVDVVHLLHLHLAVLQVHLHLAVVLQVHPNVRKHVQKYLRARLDSIISNEAIVVQRIAAHLVK